jgi:hypothetical protein
MKTLSVEVEFFRNFANALKTERKINESYLSDTVIQVYFKYCNNGINVIIMHLYIIMNKDTMMKCALEWGVNFTQTLMGLGCGLL